MDKFLKWWLENHQFFMDSAPIEIARSAWDASMNAIIESRNPEKPEKHFTCHIDIGHSDPECVLDTGNYQDCEEAGLLKEEGKTKMNCEYWRLTDE